MQHIFEFLFKYRPAEFAAGDVTVGAPWPMLVLAILAAVALLPALMAYRSLGGRATRRDRMLLAALRGAAVLLVIMCLTRPVLLLSAAVPQRNYVGVLVDDSRSMRIADQDGRARSAWVAGALSARDSSLVSSLSKRFQVRVFHFGRGFGRSSSVDSLRFDERASLIGGALTQAADALDGVPLSGLVLLSDGADNGDAPVDDALHTIKSRGIPVFTVGVGSERFDRDLEIARVEAPRRVLHGGAFGIDALIRQRGYSSQQVIVTVEDGGAIVAREEITLGPDGAGTPVHLDVLARDEGARTYAVRVAAKAGERIQGNNERTVLVDVRNRREKILYVEGEPRYEVRFVREAVRADSNLQLVVLQRTAEGKFLRLDVDRPDELLAGFPRTRAELFEYRAIILGSVEAGFFSREQLQALADFVSVRGGGLLLLGGRSAFSEGGYAATALAPVMPVELDAPASSDYLAELRVQPTTAGLDHPVTGFAARRTDGKSSPLVSVPVTTVNRISRVKPGAAVLLMGAGSANGKTVNQPVLSYQRFGRGVAAALTVQDDWLWRMHADVAIDDPTYHTFWRQLLRFLTNDVPSQIDARTREDQADPGQSVTVHATVVDSAFVRANDANVVARVLSSSGTTRDVPLAWKAGSDGDFEGSVPVRDEGVNAIVVSATRNGVNVQDTAFVDVRALDEEPFGAEMNAALLRRVASETGGRFYRPDHTHRLAEDVALSRRGFTVVNELDLWDMPAVFLLIVALVSAEWAYRKARGLA